jgi:DNA-binding transcriptional MocR family regulator
MRCIKVKVNKTEIVKNFITEEIKAGRIKSGHRLPSCREVALKLSINKITVNKAYNELEKEHMVFSIPRGGFYLVDSQSEAQPMKKEVDFYTVRPDEKLIPYREFTHAMNKAVDLYKNSLFGYESTMGLSTLRNTLSLEFEKDGIYTTPENIVITHGAQQAIALTLQCVFQKGNGKLLVEFPTYNLLLKLASNMGIDMVGIERRVDGYEFKLMEQLFKKGDISAFYVMPRHHNPTGYTLSEKHKQKIADLACKYKVLIIEDDYLGDLGSRKGVMPIHYYDTSKNTAYIRSFSKTFMPGVRLGAAVLHQSLLEAVASVKQLNDLNTSRLPQAALDVFITSGMYEKQVKKVKKSYEAKLKRAAEIFKDLSDDKFHCHVPIHGIFLWIELPDNVDAKVLEKTLKSKGIIIKSSSEFFLKAWEEKKQGSRSDNFVRLCIAGVTKEEIDSLAIVIKEIRDLEEIE